MPLPRAGIFWYVSGMDTLLEAMLDSPDLPKQLEKLSQTLADERTRREQFYAEMFPEKKLEFINGTVVLHSPAKRRHRRASGFLFQLLSLHVNRRGLGEVFHEKALVTLTRNDYEPDVAYFRQEVAIGFDDDQTKFPAPDFVAEVLSPSTKGTDRRLKKRDYASHGVGEYWIVDAEAQTIEQYVLKDEGYQCRGIWTGDDLVESTAVDGFRIPAKVVFEDSANTAALMALAA